MHGSPVEALEPYLCQGLAPGWSRAPWLSPAAGGPAESTRLSVAAIRAADRRIIAVLHPGTGGAGPGEVARVEHG